MDFSKLAKKLLNIKAFRNIVDIVQKQQKRDANNRLIWDTKATYSGIGCSISTVKKQITSDLVEWWTQVSVSFADISNADLSSRFDIVINNVTKPAVLVDKVGMVNNNPTIVKFYVK